MVNMKYNSFARAVYKGDISGPTDRIKDASGAIIHPVIDVVTLEYPLGGNNDPIVADLPKERTLSVYSTAGTLVGEVIDYQHE